jgi:hypothetical protein
MAAVLTAFADGRLAAFLIEVGNDYGCSLAGEADGGVPRPIPLAAPVITATLLSSVPIAHSPFAVACLHPSSSSRAFASFKSAVSKPSVNQL